MCIRDSPCIVVQKKTIETDGYNAIQVGFGEAKEQELNKPEKGHLSKAEVKPVKYLREFRVDDPEACLLYTSRCV